MLNVYVKKKPTANAAESTPSAHAHALFNVYLTAGVRLIMVMFCLLAWLSCGGNKILT